MFLFHPGGIEAVYENLFQSRLQKHLAACPCETHTDSDCPAKILNVWERTLYDRQKQQFGALSPQIRRDFVKRGITIQPVSGEETKKPLSSTSTEFKNLLDLFILCELDDHLEYPCGDDWIFERLEDFERKAPTNADLVLFTHLRKRWRESNMDRAELKRVVALVRDRSSSSKCLAKYIANDLSKRSILDSLNPETKVRVTSQLATALYNQYFLTEKQRYEKRIQKILKCCICETRKYSFQICSAHLIERWEKELWNSRSVEQSTKKRSSSREDYTREDLKSYFSDYLQFYIKGDQNMAKRELFVIVSQMPNRGPDDLRYRFILRFLSESIHISDFDQDFVEKIINQMIHVELPEQIMVECIERYGAVAAKYFEGHLSLSAKRTSIEHLRRRILGT